MKAVRKSRKWEVRIRKAKRNLLLLAFGLLALSTKAQITGKSIPELKQELQSPNHTFQAHFLRLNLSTLKPFNSNFTTEAYLPVLLSSYFQDTNIPNLHRYEHLPIFCKLEVKMEQAAKFPIKFRLGDVQYVDYLEGKKDIIIH